MMTACGHSPGSARCPVCTLEPGDTTSPQAVLRAELLARRFQSDESGGRYFSLADFAAANAEDPSLPDYLDVLERLMVDELAQLHFQDQWIRRVV